jgi:hypothetical protein
MKALSLWQPWASAIAIGSKRIETRSWPTNYRGPLLIHAAKHLVKSEFLQFSCDWNWLGAMAPIRPVMDHPELLDKMIPFGVIVAVAQLVSCRPTGLITLEEIRRPRTPDGQKPGLYDWTEEQMGNFSHNRFAWFLEGVRALPQAIPYTGHQGLFEVPDHGEAMISLRRQLGGWV